MGLQDPPWNNTTVLKGEAVSEVSKLTQRLDGDIAVYASFRLVPALLERDLTDELRLMFYPGRARAGERLWTRRHAWRRDPWRSLPSVISPAGRPVATRLRHGCRFPLVRRHRMRNGAGKPVTGLWLLLPPGG
jgi:hypothetical protein